MSAAEGKRFQTALCGRISDLLHYYREVLDAFAQNTSSPIIIPRPVAYEFQHAVTHLAHSYLCGSPQDRWRQYGSAIGHLERGVLDAYKILFFRSDLHAGLGRTQDFAKLIRCRLSEYSETNNARMEPKLTRNNHAILRYRSLYQEILGPDTASHAPSSPVSFPSEARREHLAFFALIHEWGQCELILSAFTGDKNIPALRDMMNAVFHTFSIPMMQKAIANLYRNIAHAALAGVTRDLVVKRIESDPGSFGRYSAAQEAIRARQPENSAIRLFVQQDIFVFFGIELTPYRPVV